MLVGSLPSVALVALFFSNRMGLPTANHRACKRYKARADVCRHIHRSLVEDLHYALVWGISAKHAPQRVGGAHVMEDEDVVQIVKRKG